MNTNAKQNRNQTTLLTSASNQDGVIRNRFTFPLKTTRWNTLMYKRMIFKLLNRRHKSRIIYDNRKQKLNCLIVPDMVKIHYALREYPGHSTESENPYGTYHTP